MQKAVFIVTIIIFQCSCMNQTDYEYIGIKKDSINRKNMNNGNTGMRFIELSDSSTVKCKDLTPQEFKKLLKEREGKVVREYKEDEYVLYELNDGTAIIGNDDDAILYFSLKDAEKVIQDHEKEKMLGEGEKSSQHILLNKNPYGKDFPDYTKQLSRKLAEALEINLSLKGRQLIQNVDERVHNTADPIDFYRSHFIHLIALIGDTVIDEYGAAWEMRLDTESQVWEPRMKYRGKYIDFVSWLWEDIYQRQDPTWPIATEAYETAKGIIRV